MNRRAIQTRLVPAAGIIGHMNADHADSLTAARATFSALVRAGLHDTTTLPFCCSTPMPVTFDTSCAKAARGRSAARTATTVSGETDWWTPAWSQNSVATP